MFKAFFDAFVRARQSRANFEVARFVSNEYKTGLSVSEIKDQLDAGRSVQEITR